MEQKTQNTKPPILEDLNRWQKITEEALQKLLPSASTWPTILHQAMCYSLFAGGKRLRPAIIFASAETTQQFLGTNSGKLSDDCFERAKICACAIECLHTYSLIHDDLPCMDNDDLRRGRPTCHKVYGEAIAVLAGDALLTESFALLAKIKPTSRFSVSEFVACLARAASSRNLVGGQATDILSENKKISPRELRRIHSTKTAALLSASARLGAM
ncbi:MAG: polyprenyl synthetase family protein, partial [Chthoniobacterales bacterium]|nr:polyprenyl synthetase family protein [Chthoniobacterales bacterium]